MADQDYGRLYLTGLLAAGAVALAIWIIVQMAT